MTISEKRKKTAEKQRMKKIQACFKAYSDVRINKRRYAVRDRREMNGEYYFLLQGVKGNPFVAKLVYSCNVKAIRICTTSNCYKQNKAVFDEWIKQEKIRQNYEIQKFYEEARIYHIVVVRDTVDIDWKSKHCNLISKKKYKGKYYFIVRNKDKICFVVKIVYYDFPKAIKLSAQEFEKNKEVFEPWLEQYKGK